MNVRKNMKIFILAATAMLMTSGAFAQDAKFTVESSSYKDFSTIPKIHAGAAANCGGGSELSPPVAWKNLPSGAKSVVVLFSDPDGQKGLGTSHLVAYNIAADRGELRQGEAQKSGDGITIGPNVTGEPAYRGMCAQATDNPHHYTLTVIATDIEAGTLPEGLDRQKLLEALKGKALVGQSIVGLYGQ